MFNTVSLFRRIQENVTTNQIQVSLCYLFGLLCLLPLFYDSNSRLEESVLRDALTFKGYRYTAVATLALAIPFTLDLVTDLVFKPKGGRQSNEKTVVKEGFLNNTEKVLFLIGNIMLPIVAFFPENTIHWAYIYICCNKCQQILTCGAIVISLCRYDNSIWTNRTTYCLIIFLGLGNVLICTTKNRFNVLAFEIPTRNAASLIADLLVVITAFTYSLALIRWIRAQYRKKGLYPSMSQKASDLIYPLIYMMMPVICIVVLVVLTLRYQTLTLHTGAAILINSLIYFCYMLFIIFLSMRMVKSEVVQGLYALIESKKVYVRYISHELRTPLNAGNRI
jgi:hypothetical protein